MQHDILKHNFEIGQYVIFIHNNSTSCCFNYGTVEKVFEKRVRIRKRNGETTLKNNDKVIVIDDLLAINEEKYPENFL